MALPRMKRPETEQPTCVGGQTLGSQLSCWWGEGWSPLGRQVPRREEHIPALSWPLVRASVRAVLALWETSPRCLGALAPRLPIAVRNQRGRPAWGRAESSRGRVWGPGPCRASAAMVRAGTPAGVDRVAVSRSVHLLVVRSVW